MPTDQSAKTDIFGICTAVGRDVGFHPDVLRVAFAIGLFVNPAVALGLYAALGVIVLISRRLYPVAPSAAAAPAAIAIAAVEEAEPLRLAA